MRDPEGRAPGREDLVERGGLWNWIPTLVAFLIIFGFLIFRYYKPNLLFSLTTAAGGDTGAHHYPAQYLIQELLPNFRLTGWAPGWYAGMPMLTFYFPFPFLLIAILNWILPYTVAFKIGTVLGVFALPFTVYAFGRLLRIRRPFPVLAAVFAVVFLLMESYSIYGANIKSTLAGEFGYMFSFALVFLWLGTMHRGMEKPKLNMLFVLNCLILMALVLSHIVSTIALVFISPGLLLLNPRWRSLGYLAVVAAMGFALSAFWSLPFAGHLEWTAHMAWNQLGWEGLGGMWLLPVAIPAVVGFFFAIAKRETKLLPLLWMSVVVFIVYWILPEGRLWNARVVPFWYLSVHLWAAYGVTWLVRPFTVWFHDLFGTRGVTGRRFFAPATAAAVFVAVMIFSEVFGASAAGWIRWNYSGYEGKEKWGQYEEINNYINSLGEGRVMVEHGSKIDEFGTPRAFEIIPYWTNLDTMEGTLMEASFTAPFHFINQAELSKQPSNAIIGVDYPGLNVSNGITHLQYMNIEYFLTCSEEVTEATKDDSRADLLATFGDYNIFRISGMSGYAEVMRYQPVTMDVRQDEWRDVAVDWYKDMDALEVPFIWDNGEEPLDQFAAIPPEQATIPPKVPIETGRVISETLENEGFSFEVDQAAVGKPVLIKISYFPNWHAKGADGPYLASPSFMMVIPTETQVELYYGRTWLNTLGQTLQGIAWVILIGLSIWCLVLWRRRRRLAGAGGSGVIAVNEFTGQYLEGREQRYDSETGLWVTVEPGEEPATADADAESAIARYEAGDQGWSSPADEEPGADDLRDADDPSHAGAEEEPAEEEPRA